MPSPAELVPANPHVVRDSGFSRPLGSPATRSWQCFASQAGSGVPTTVRPLHLGGFTRPWP
jgi:hypothetical protein